MNKAFVFIGLVALVTVIMFLTTLFTAGEDEIRVNESSILESKLIERIKTLEDKLEKSDFNLRVDSLRNGTMLCYAKTCGSSPIIGRTVKYVQGIWKWDHDYSGNPTKEVAYIHCLNNDYKDLKEAIDALEAAEAGATPDPPVSTPPVEPAPVDPTPVTPPSTVRTTPPEPPRSPVTPRISVLSLHDDCMKMQRILYKVMAVEFNDVNYTEAHKKSDQVTFMQMAKDFLQKVKSLPQSEQSGFRSTCGYVKDFFDL